MLWEEYKSEFIPNGLQRDLLIRDVDTQDWQSVIHFLKSSHARLIFYVDGKEAPLPNNFAAFINDRSHQYLLSVNLGGVDMNCPFNSADQIELLFDPVMIDDEFKANLIFRLMSTIGRTLDKPVYCAHVDVYRDPVFQYTPGQSVEYLAKLKK